MNVQKMLTSYKKKTRRRAEGPERIGFERSTTDDPCFRCASLINSRENSQAPRSEI